MKRLLMLALLGMFTAGIVGCHASADVDPDTDAHGTTSYQKKTTTVHEPDGDTSTKTEVKRY
jgi:hypothetical protein